MNKPVMNPILKKELTLGSRSIRFPVAVMVYAGVMSLIAILVLVGGSMVTSYAYNGYAAYSVVDYSALTRSFLVLAYVQLAMICVIIPILTAGSIAGERERQTLDIMLVAPVSPWSIVTGKLLASLSNVFIFVVSTLPALSLCFLYGGIQWQYLLVFLLSMMIMAFFVGAVGIWCSSVFKKTVASVIITMIIEGIFFIGPLFFLGIASGVSYAHAVRMSGGSTFPDSISLGWLPAVLLLDPLIGFIDGMSASTSGTHAMDGVLTMFSSAIKAPGHFDILTNHWCWISYVITILLGVFFMWWAAYEIDSTRRKGKRMRKKKA